jgi:lipopolysaccharide transport system ATP-binding protein
VTDAAIRATGLKKVYRLYTKPAYRFRDIFGLLGHVPGAFTEHAALDGVDLTIGRGEKVAIIGRNGAGKSTFLKLVTRVIQPSSGTLDVTGHVHALLQIGTGFHPDFTGRQNVYAYLAQLGVTGAQADRRCADVIAFAELEEYIDQPVKSYSTGMTVRLMFSASTAITPDLLVLDEVLGVGDAYFAHKSYERIRELCDRKGTTLLLVTHDIYSAVKLCGRTIWLDRGRVLMDGDSPEVVKAYEDSIRQQEENRLRLSKQARVRTLQTSASARETTTPVLLEVYAQDNHPQPCPVYFSRLELALGVARDERRAALPLGPLDADAFDERMPSHLQREGTCWGEPLDWHGRPARALLNYGSPFHKIAGVIEVALAEPDVTSGHLVAEVDYWSEQPCRLQARAFIGRREVPLGPLPPSDGSWVTFRVPIDGESIEPQALTGQVNTSGRHGTGGIVVLDVTAGLDSGEESYVFQHGAPANIFIRYQVNDPALREHAQVLLAFHRDGVVDTCRMMTRGLLFDGSRGGRGAVRVHVPGLMLANGTYTVTVMIAKEGYYDREQTRYFSLNPEVYTCLSRVIEIVVRGGGIVGTGTGVVAAAEWSLVESVTT